MMAIGDFILQIEHSESIIISYKNSTVCALWSDGNLLELHRWEYHCNRAPEQFDIEHLRFFDVCKITGIDEL
jgi:hypothetical protein